MEKKTMATNILILGAGIGGYEAFRSLAKRLKRAGIKKKITIVDENNYFTFIPLLHEVASGAVEPEHCTLALREVTAGTPYEFIKGRVVKIDPIKKLVALNCPEADCGGISYDICIIALGSTINYSGVDGAAEHSYHIRTLGNALSFRRALIDRFDSPETEVTVSVIGGGTTGVEVAGQIGYLLNHDLKRLYPNKTGAVRLVESSTELAGRLPPKARLLIARRLRRLGIQVLLGTGVKAVGTDELILENGEKLKSDLTLWATGIKNTAKDLLPKDYCDDGRVPTDDFLRHPRDSSLYAIGDIANCFDAHCQISIPQLGEAAHRQGQYLAKQLVSAWRGRPITNHFHFISRGTLMSVGERYGLIIRGRFVIAGWFAWVIRRAVYVWFMPGIARKIKILSDWLLRSFGSADIISINRK